MWRKKRSWEPPIRIPHEEHEKRTKERIRIPYTVIQIPESEVMKNKARRFESSSYEFEFLSKSKGWRLKVRQSDSNLRDTDSNPSWHKIQSSLRRFESPTQRFESLMVQNSNLAQAIRIPFESPKQRFESLVLQKYKMRDLQPQLPDFQVKSLSQRLVKALQRS